jgi:regulator of sigma E protease
LDILLTIVCLGLLIFVHEVGHFVSARLMRVKVDTFSIGFGPKILKFVRHETVYAISLIPLGGYVKMKGDNPEDTEHEPDSFFAKNPYQRAFIAFGGPLANLFLAVILIFFSYNIGFKFNDFRPVIDSAGEPYSTFFSQGDEILSINHQEIKSFTDIFHQIDDMQDNLFLIQRDSLQIYESIFIDTKIDFYRALRPISSRKIGEVNPGLPAWKAGLQTGDEIVMIDGIYMENWEDIRTTISSSMNHFITLTIIRDEASYDITVHPDINPLSDDNSRIIGITQYQDISFVEKFGVMQSLKLSVITTASYVYLNYQSLFQLFKKPETLKSSVGGPVMIYQMTSQISKRGLSSLLLFVGALSIILMIMNLLPIPVLDGGQIIFCLYEIIFRKPLPLKVQVSLQQIGFMILVALMVYAFYSDISKMATRTTSAGQWR